MSTPARASVKDGGEQFAPAYRYAQPGRPAARARGTTGLSLPQSLAIIEYLDDCIRRSAACCRRDARGRARVRALALAIACDIHPLNNLRVLKYLSAELGITDGQKKAWYRHWVARAWQRWRSSWCEAATLACTAMAIRQPWRTAAWCRSSTTHGVSTAT